MRILFLTNFYLVNESGGEDQSCQQVVEGLKQRGHTILVLTSMHGNNNMPVYEDGIHRSLYLEMDLVPWQNSLTFFTRRKAREKHNGQCLEKVMDEFRPDIIFIWGMWNLPKSLPALAEARYPDRVVYRFASYWPTLPSQYELYWRARGRTWYSRILKGLLGRVALAMLTREVRQLRLNFRHAICVSAATRQGLVEAGVPVANAKVIHTGLDATRYLKNRADTGPDSEKHSLNLLYAGRLVPEKGIDTAIAALEKLIRDQGRRDIRLQIAGSDSAGYESHLRHLVTQAGLDDFVSFLGHVPSDEMPRLLQHSEVLLVPSLWAEPFSRMVLEGMISGLVVVAASSGGTTEVLKDRENGLLFSPGDADTLAGQVLRLAVDPGLRHKLASAGQQTVLEQFVDTRMLDEIESYLQEVARLSSDEPARQVKLVEDNHKSSSRPSVSVIIPTHNRRGPLLETLASLTGQTYPRDRFEVIVVDDGSTDDTPTIAHQQLPFDFRYVHQKNQGATAARNHGATLSHADILVFIDDDVTISPQALEALAETCIQSPHVVVVGTLIRRSRGQQSIYAAIMKDTAGHAQSIEDVDLHFLDCNTELIACKRSDFFELGMLQDPTRGHGWPNWDDVDFGFRAHRAGFRLLRSSRAIGEHWDYSLADRTTACRRWYRAAKSAVWLFKKHPELRNLIPMLQDKTPIAWRQDPPGLIARKLARSLMAAPPMIGSMENFISLLERHHPSPLVLRRLYHWLQGAYMLQGYRGGLREMKQA